MKLVDYSICDIITAFEQSRTIIGVGAGKALDTFCNEFREYEIDTVFSAIADNNKMLSHTMRKTENRQIPIYSVEDIVNEFEMIDIIVITSQYFQDIYRQLQSFPQLKETKIVFYGFVIDNYCDQKLANGDMDCEIVKMDGVQIPKIIHYCWFGKSRIPDRYREWMKSWKKYCPDYEIVEWNEDNYDVYKNNYMAEAYEAKKWGFVPDYARLDIVSQHGGIYLDTDVEVVQNLDPLLSQSAFCGFEETYSIALGLGFGAVSGNAYILAMREAYEGKHFKKSDGNYDLTPSPTYQTRTLIEHGLQPTGRFQILEDLAVYPKVFFSPMNHYNRKVNKNHHTFTIHHFDGSWVGNGEKEEWAQFAEIYARMSNNCAVM